MCGPHLWSWQLCSTSLRGRIPTKLLGFFCTGDLFLLSHLSIYPIYFYQQRFMEQIYITIYIVIIEYHILLLKLFHLWPLRAPSAGSSTLLALWTFFFPFFLFLLPSFFLPFFSILLHSGIIRCSKLISCLSYHDLKISHLSKKPSFLYQSTAMGTKVWVLSEFIATGVCSIELQYITENYVVKRYLKFTKY